MKKKFAPARNFANYLDGYFFGHTKVSKLQNYISFDLKQFYIKVSIPCVCFFCISPLLCYFDGKSSRAFALSAFLL